MKVPQEAVSAAVGIIEEAADNIGWDGRPAVLLIFGAPIGDTGDPRMSTYARTGMDMGAVLISPLELGDDVWEHAHAGSILECLADQFAEDDVDPVVHAMAVPAFIGIALVTEAWANADPAASADPRALPDIPGTVEVRCVDCVDVSGRYTRVERIRGGHSEVAEYGGQVPARTAYHDIPNNLRRIVLGVARRMRPDDADVHALSNMAVRDRPRPPGK